MILATSLKKFRHAVSVLKKAGLLPKTTDSGQKLDARWVRPTSKVGGRKLSTLVDKFDNVASGKATAIKVPENRLRSYRKTGFETARGRVIVPHAATEKVRMKKGEITVISSNGIERVQIPVEFQNLQQWLRDMEKNREEINRMKRDNEWFGIRFYGNMSAQYDADISFLLERLSQYEAVQNAHSRYKQTDIYKHLEIVKMPHAAAVQHSKEYSYSRTKAKAEKNARRWRANMDRQPLFRREKIKTQTAARMKAYRERMKTNNPKQYKKYVKDAVERAKERRKAE